MDSLLPDPDRAAADAAVTAIDLIDRRTRKDGKDIHGRRFRGYARATKESRRERGRQTSHVDLVDTGKMLGSMTYRTRGGKAEIYFGTAAENDKAAGHQFGLGRLPKREFFGLTKDEQKQVAKVALRRRRG